ncbi:glycosyltransferase family 2 protein [Lacinutrix neustonica]|uniref:Glycosyltransferase family 2 protein n=1 Tax=Lacinutrix neustonica TaxID=2980107 RepID=A0A9E8SFJ9_9FLAO|nr:glycosyltransferase family 2 protein [Lacinutrix neustonica]WAC03499.1 glycosyltransferase family 2 protein [Lacinutrix neustonica]
MKLSVIILSYNVRYFLELCLQSVEGATRLLDAEIIVVDNHSQDESCDMVKALFPKVKLIENKENLGFSKGNNIGVAEAKGEYLCILNPDTVVAEDAFRTLLKFADAQNNVGIIGCRLIDGNGGFLPESKRNIPTVTVAVNKMLRKTKDYYAAHIQETGIGQSEILVGAFMLLKQQVYHEVGGFDDDYFMYGEDIDLSYKVSKAGYNNLYFGKVTTIHFKGESTLKDKIYAKRFYGAMQIFYKKHFKRNLWFDTLVWFGIQLAKMSPKKRIKIKLKFSKYAVVSDIENIKLKETLEKPVSLVALETPISKETQLIFDANVIPFKEMITYFSESEKNKNITFKILPKNANFILGSHSAKSRGEVITF